MDGETLIAIETLDISLSISLLAEELIFGRRPNIFERKLQQILQGNAWGRPRDPLCKVPVVLHTDSKDLMSHCNRLTFDQGLKKRRKTDIADLQECMWLGVLAPLVKILGTKNPVDALTKPFADQSPEVDRLKELVQKGWYLPPFGNPKDVSDPEVWGRRKLPNRKARKGLNPPT